MGFWLTLAPVIHPTAVIHPNARLDPSVRVGPCAVIDSDVQVGPSCVIGPNAYLTGFTRIGARNQIFAGCVIGEAPQDLKYKGERTELRIGDDNVFREHCTVHRSSTVGTSTVIGNRNLFMAASHVAHNCTVGNSVIVANGALLGGYATVHDLAFISGSCLVHQFVTVGTLVMMQGGSAISKDLPPYTIARGDNRICGLNVIGLRRAGISAEQRMDLKQLYRCLFRSGRNMNTAVEIARQEPRFTTDAPAVLLEFVANSKRGVCTERRSRAALETADEG